jgi:N-acetylmuramoyl-L-alanine amidase
MRRRLIFTLFTTLLFALSGYSANHRFTLVIDAGHGGHDAGARGATSMEKNINLNTALAFGRLVERNCPDVKVIYTRKTDVFVPLHERADIANKNKADLFISIHTNALPEGKIAKGLETYTLGMHRAADNFDVAKRENSVILVEKDYKQRYAGFDPNSSESYIMFEFIQDKNMAKSVELAKMVQSDVCSSASRPDKGVKQAGFLVLRETSMPSCLIELGFITTPEEEQMLNTDSRIDDIARGIYRAFVDYKSKYDQGISVPFAAETKEQVDLPTIVPQSPKTETVQEKDDKKDSVKDADDDDAPVFKLQILASDHKLKRGDSRLKGVDDVDSYEEGNLVKYTTGSSKNYNEVNKLRKELSEKFPDAFIIAFKGGKKTDIKAAIAEYKSNKK